MRQARHRVSSVVSRDPAFRRVSVVQPAERRSRCEVDFEPLHRIRAVIEVFAYERGRVATRDGQSVPRHPPRTSVWLVKYEQSGRRTDPDRSRRHGLERLPAIRRVRRDDVAGSTRHDTKQPRVRHARDPIDAWPGRSPNANIPIHGSPPSRVARTSSPSWPARRSAGTWWSLVVPPGRSAITLHANACGNVKSTAVTRPPARVAARTP